ncbi:hypothetical protein HGM15179_003095 [Zosterops borbonicus]|uniref:Uncharacterized protein n=1 Tax=Zosterops borbonicus TaxID=364589 RepID=A0A8K1GTF9_9PASS|nr:hypothetical protein HGM15179_003095 [Zosterops borbonicus]
MESWNVSRLAKSYQVGHCNMWAITNPGCFRDGRIEEEGQMVEIPQRRATKMGKSLEVKLYEEQLRSLGLFSLDKRRPHCSYNFLVRGREWADTDLCSVVTVTGPKGMA